MESIFVTVPAGSICEKLGVWAPQVRTVRGTDAWQPSNFHRRMTRRWQSRPANLLKEVNLFEVHKGIGGSDGWLDRFHGRPGEQPDACWPSERERLHFGGAQRWSRRSSRFDGDRPSLSSRIRPALGAPSFPNLGSSDAAPHPQARASTAKLQRRLILKQTEVASTQCRMPLLR